MSCWPAGVPIDVFGVGAPKLSTSADAPTLGVVYKMVEMLSTGGEPSLHAQPGPRTRPLCPARNRFSATPITMCWRVPANVRLALAA